MGEQQEGGPSLVVHRVPPLGSEKIIFGWRYRETKGARGSTLLTLGPWEEEKGEGHGGSLGARAGQTRQASKAKVR